MKLAPEQRIAIEILAETEALSLGEATRKLIDAGIAARESAGQVSQAPGSANKARTPGEVSYESILSHDRI
jgi:hypothetical protein